MHKRNARVLKTTIATVSITVALLMTLFTATLPALSAPKAIDWDKKLVKARQLLETNNIEEAEKIYDDQLKKHPEAGAVHTDLGKCYKKRGKLAMAKAEFKRSTEVEPTYAEAWYELGAMNQSDKEYDLAANSFSHFLQLAPYSEKRESVKDKINFCKSQM